MHVARHEGMLEWWWESGHGQREQEADMCRRVVCEGASRQWCRPQSRLSDLGPGAGSGGHLHRYMGCQEISTYQEGWMGKLTKSRLAARVMVPARRARARLAKVKRVLIVGAMQTRNGRLLTIRGTKGWLGEGAL